MLDRNTLINSVSPPLDRTLTEQLISEYVSQESRFILRDWEPSTLDGGQFAEVAARIIYHIDSGNLNRRRTVDKSLDYVEDPKQSNKHRFPERKASLHLAKVLRTIYKFRSDRGAIHIDPQYSANELDSKLVIECVRWVMAEILRSFWNSERSEVARAIREIIQYEVPAVGLFEGKLLVQRTDLSIDDEMLVLLHHAGSTGLSRTQLGQYIPKDAPTISRAIKRISSPNARNITRLSDGNYVLTGLGARKVLLELADKLRVQ